MIEAYRVAPEQGKSYFYEATRSGEQAAYLELLLEASKPPEKYPEWPALVSASFARPLPVLPAHQARFKAPFSSRNVFHCSAHEQTALFEAAYHYLKERVGRKAMRLETSRRAIYSLPIRRPAFDLRGHRDEAKIMDKKSYAASHKFIRGKERISVLAYPSCRDPKRRLNLAAFDIKALGRKMGESRSLEALFSPEKSSIRWIELDLEISWSQVS